MLVTRLMPNVCSLLHPAMLQHYQPVLTSPNGDCLWNSLSTCIVGAEQMSNDLRLVTQQVILHNKQMFLRLITRDHINEAGTPTEILNRHI